MCGQRGIPTLFPDTRGSGEYGQSCTILHHGFQEWILAGLHGPRVTAVYCIHGWQPWCLWIYQDALWIVQCASDIPAFDAEYTGRLNLTYCTFIWMMWSYGHTEEEHLECLRVYGVLQRIQPEAETLQVLLLPDGDSVPCTSCPQRRNFPKWGKCACHHGVSHARNLHWSKSILQIVRSSCHFIRNFVHLAHALYDLLGDEIKMGPVMLMPEVEKWWKCWKRRSHQHQYWCSLTLISFSYWKLMHQKRGLERCFHRSKMMDATIL